MTYKKLIFALILLIGLGLSVKSQTSLSSPIPAVGSLPTPCASNSFPNVAILTAGTPGLYACVAGSWVSGGGGSPGPTGPTGSTGPPGPPGATGATGPAGGGSSTVTTVTCANTTGTDDALAIQSAINSAPSQNSSIGGGGTTNPVVIQIASGICLINSTILLNKPGVILKGYNPTHQSFNGTSNITNPGTVLINVSGFGGPFIRADAGDVTTPGASGLLRGVGIQDLTFSNFNGTTTNGFSSHYQVETGSLSDPAPFSGLTFFNFTAGAISFAPSYTSTVTNGSVATPYDPEGIVFSNFMAISNTSSQPSGIPIIMFKGCNQTKAYNGRIKGNITGVSHTASDTAAIEIDSDIYAQLLSEGVTIENVSGGTFPVWIRVKGADNSKTQTNGSSCTTIGGCSISPTQHTTPRSITVLHNFIEGFNRGIVVGVDDTSSFSGWTINDVRVDSTNRFITPFGSGSLVASVNNAAGGEFSLGYSETLLSLPTISLGSVTANILSRVPYNISSGATFPVSSSSPNNNCVAISGPVTFANKPTSACTGTTMIFSDGSCTSGGTCTGGGSYRGVVWNGSNWVGQ